MAISVFEVHQTGNTDSRKKNFREFDVQLCITTHSIEAIDGTLATQDYYRILN